MLFSVFLLIEVITNPFLFAVVFGTRLVIKADDLDDLEEHNLSGTN